MIISRLGAVAMTAAAGVALLAAPATGATTTSTPKVISSCTAAKVKPTSYVLTCADGGVSITHVRYSTAKGLGWGHSYVEAKGTYVYNDCTPSCAGGTFHHHPIDLGLSRIRTVAGVRLYTRLSASYAGLTESFPLPTKPE